MTTCLGKTCSFGLNCVSFVTICRFVYDLMQHGHLNYASCFVLSVRLVGWLFLIYWPFETVFQSISGRLPERERGRKRRERIEESKNVQTTPTRTYCKRKRPLPYCHPNCRTPRPWKFTQVHRTTRPPLCLLRKNKCYRCFQLG